MKVEIEQTVESAGEGIRREILVHSDGEPLSEGEFAAFRKMVDALSDGLDNATEHTGADWRFLVKCIRR